MWLSIRKAPQKNRSSKTTRPGEGTERGGLKIAEGPLNHIQAPQANVKPQKKRKGNVQAKKKPIRRRKRRAATEQSGHGSEKEKSPSSWWRGKKAEGTSELL